MPRFISLIVLLLLSVKDLAIGQSTGTWMPVEKDLEIMEASADGGILTPKIQFIRTRLERFDLDVVRAKELGLDRGTAKALAIKSHSVFAINANFFDENGRPLGLVLSEGRIFQPLHSSGKVLTGIFQILPSGPEIIARSDFKNSQVSEAIQAGPRLISHGRRVEGLRDEIPQRRAGVCLDKTGAIIFYVSSGNFSRIGIKDLQDMLLSSSVGCVSALNLDGGSSAQAYLKTMSVEIDLPGLDSVPVVLALSRRPLR